MELRQLEAFVTVADELHFKRAAEKLHIGQPTLSDLVRRLERDLGTPLFTRTTRRVALTEAGVELLSRARAILEDVAGADAAVRRIAGGDAGTVRLGVTPPVVPTLTPHLTAALRREAPDVELVVQRMWLSDFHSAIPDGIVDVTITCGLVPDPPGVISEVFCAEPLVVSVRPDHRFAGRQKVSLEEMSVETLGLRSADLYPSSPMAMRQVLEAAGISPPTIELDDIDFSARRWADQADVDWILTTTASAGVDFGNPLIPLSPPQYLPYTLQWCPIRAATAAVGRFVNLVLNADVPPGWVELPDHFPTSQTGE
ncbi:LysR family transcriptional regulator [Mycolicibacterium sp.]|uniref:LysR family transcriptional regulator n=1 Tax=Mycolicibacterium sp. TaxID=2320850 RepID=UPI001A1DF52D|nr:LysR family transcriptional regulator [Mycolicibacterium sp.]MBJ7337291.1 LysR family transcriptional regulator [Mycolicibacterium sp.]